MDAEILNNYVAVLSEINGVLNDEKNELRAEIQEPPKDSDLSEVYLVLWHAKNTVETFQSLLKKGDKPSLLKIKYQTAIVAFNRAVVAVDRALKKTAKNDGF